VADKQYIPFDPEKHKDVPLYEVQTVDSGDDLVDAVIVRSNVLFEVAKEIPWYYLVESEDEKK